MSRKLAADLARRTERLRAEPAAEDDAIDDIVNSDPAAPINPLAAEYNAEQGASDRAAERIFPTPSEPEPEPPAEGGDGSLSDVGQNDDARTTQRKETNE